MTVKAHFVCMAAFFFTTAVAFADPEVPDSGIAIDLNHLTNAYDSADCAKDVESSLWAKADDEIIFAVVAQNTENLDAYQFDILFDPNRLSILDCREDMPGFPNLLKSGGGKTLWVPPKVENGVATIASTLVGNGKTDAVTGALCHLKAKIRSEGSEIGLTLRNFVFLDNDGEKMGIGRIGNAMIRFNHPPKIIGVPKTEVRVGDVYRFEPAASDDDKGDLLVFNIANKPDWATFDPATGLLEGAPKTEDIGIHRNITLSVSDSYGASDTLAAFNITVFEKNEKQGDSEIDDSDSENGSCFIGTINPSGGISSMVLFK